MVAVIIVVLVLASIPSIYAVINTPEGAVWTGLINRNTNDINGYLSIIEEVRSDGLLAHNLMTAEPHPAFQFRPFHAVLGILGKIFPGLSPVVLLEIGRIIATIFFLSLLAHLVILFYETTPNRIFAFLIMTLGSGLGWAHLTELRPDLGYSELSTFSSLVSAPLYQLSLGCVLGIILSFAAAYQAESFRMQVKYSLIAALFAVILGFERPFSLITLGFTMAGFALIEILNNKHKVMKLLLSALPLAIAAGSVILYQFFLIKNIPVYAEWNRQNILSSPPLIAIFLSLGLLIPLAIFGVPEAIRKNRILALIFCCFAISSLVCSKIPVQVQERFLEGLPVSTALLASAGAIRLKGHIKAPALQFGFAVALIALLIPSNVIVTKNDLQRLAERFVPQYMPLSFMESLEILEKVSKPGEAVLSLELAGNFVIAYSSRPAVIAHRIGTARVNEKKKLVTDLFELDAESSAAKALIQKANAAWLFWGPEERDYARGRFKPETASYLEEQHNNKMVTIYKIK